MTDGQRRIFLSYSVGEKPYVRAVADELGRRGVDTWLDESELAVGASLQDQLADAIRSARVMVVFVTGESLASPALNFEIGAAVGSEKRVIPVFLSAAARKAAPAVLHEHPGIEAFDLKPEQVAEEIARAIDAAATAT